MWLVRTSVMVCVPQCASREGGSPRFPILRTPPFFWAWAAPVQPPTARATATRPTAIARLPPMGTLPVCSHHREQRPACVGLGGATRGAPMVGQHRTSVKGVASGVLNTGGGQRWADGPAMIGSYRGGGDGRKGTREAGRGIGGTRGAGRGIGGSHSAGPLPRPGSGAGQEPCAQQPPRRGRPG